MRHKTREKLMNSIARKLKSSVNCVVSFVISYIFSFPIVFVLSVGLSGLSMMIGVEFSSTKEYIVFLIFLSSFGNFLLNLSLFEN